MSLLTWHSGESKTKGTETRLIVEDGGRGRKRTKRVMRKLLLDRNILYLDCGGGYMIMYIFQNSKEFYLKNRSYALIILTLHWVEELPTHRRWKSDAFQLHRDKPPSSGPSQTSACASLHLVVHRILYHTLTSLVAQTVKRLSTVRETRVRALGWGDPLEKEMAIHSTTIAWKIPWTEEPGRLQSMGSQRVRYDWATSFTLISQKTWKKKTLRK